ncbi:MAG: carboxypeptidase-like regulatory domain-containing protein, partial [Leadbetterella sp.]|nr:carboxypeptidase-like regulatory domain-containing protein [Leadbetterella sp.]
MENKMKKIILGLLFLLSLFIINSCKKELPTDSSNDFVLSGKILDMEKGTPIPGASISLGGAGAFSDTDGYFIFKNLTNSNYTFSVSHPGYEAYSQNIIVSKNVTLNIFLSLKPIPVFTLSGTILDSAKHTPIVGALVTIGEFEDSTDISGHFSFGNLKSGEYVLSTTHPYYENYSQNIKILNDTTISLSFLIKQIEFFKLNFGQTKYHYSYDKTHGSPRPTSTKARGIATWDIIEVFKRDSKSVYNVLETVVDTVEKWDYYGGTFTSSGTWTQYFEILEDSNHVLTSMKFPDNISIPRYIRADAQKDNFYYSSSNGYINVSKDVGIINILKAWGIISPNTDGEYIGYTLIR